MARVPQLDTVPASPVDWADIPLGAGQEPNAFGHNGAFQFTQDASPYDPYASVRRNPDESWQIISRVPERW